jgi:hypothetical protein
VETVATLWSITQGTDFYQQGIKTHLIMCPLWLAVCGEVLGQQYNQMEKQWDSSTIKWRSSGTAVQSNGEVVEQQYNQMEK